VFFQCDPDSEKRKNAKILFKNLILSGTRYSNEGLS
jgi:hypothetical protein